MAYRQRGGEGIHTYLVVQTRAYVGRVDEGGEKKGMRKRMRKREGVRREVSVYVYGEGAGLSMDGEVRVVEGYKGRQVVSVDRFCRWECW